MPVSDEIKQQIIEMLGQGMDRNSISDELGVSPGQVSAIKAHIKMGSYVESPDGQGGVEVAPATVVEKSTPENEESFGLVTSSNSTQGQAEREREQEIFDTKEEAVLFEPSEGQVPPILVGDNLETGREVYWTPDPASGTPNPHMLILGSSGSGKTYAIQCLVGELARVGVPSILFDYGQGFALDSVEPEFKDMASPVEIDVGRDGISINPLQLFKSDVHGPVNVAQRIADTFLSVYPKMGIQQHAILREAVLEVMQAAGFDPRNNDTWNREAPPFTNLRRRLEAIANDNQDNRRRHAASVSSHISTIFVFNTFNNEGTQLNWKDLIDQRKQCTVLKLKGLEKTLEKGITEFLLWNLYGYIESLGPANGKLRCFAVLDEAHRISFDEGAAAGKFLREARKFGLGLMLASQEVLDFSPVALSNTNTKIVFQMQNIASATINSLFGTDFRGGQRIKKVIHNLKRGESVLNGRSVENIIGIKSIKERV